MVVPTYFFQLVCKITPNEIVLKKICEQRKKTKKVYFFACELHIKPYTEKGRSEKTKKNFLGFSFLFFCLHCDYHHKERFHPQNYIFISGSPKTNK